MIRFLTLGATELNGSDGMAIRSVLCQPKRLALLAYLAVSSPRGFHRRDRLLGLFWPELDESRARAALSQSIYYLRHSLGHEVVRARSGDELAVDPEWLWCDVAAFEAALDEGALARALELYAGDLLPGLVVPEAPEWDRWLEDVRVGLRRRAATAAWTLATTEGHQGNASAAGHWARRASTLATDDEQQLRELIVLLDRLGDRSGAVALYEEAAARLLREYDMEASPETRALAARVRSRTAVIDPALASRSQVADSEAHTEYLRGRYLLDRLDPVAGAEARRHLERSLELDPTVARVWTALSEAYGHLAKLTVLPASEAFPRARAAAERALEIDPTLAEAHATLAMSLSWYYWDIPGAERSFRRALELEPDTARTHRLYAVHLRNLGRFDEALVEIHHAQDLDPLFAFSHVEEGIILYMARRYRESIAKLGQLLRVDSRFTHAYLFVAMAQVEEGRFEEALQALQASDPDQTNADAQGMRGYVFARMGRQGDARRVLTQLERMAAAHPVSAFQMAAVHVGLGEAQRALDCLERAASEQTWHMRLLAMTPVFDSLRDEPRFQALLERSGAVSTGPLDQHRG